MSQRVSVGDRSSMLVARAIDNQEVEKLTLDVQNACESILGSRNVAQYIPEIQLLGTLLYYSFSLKTRCSTPGQDYTNMMMVTRGKERTIGDASGPFGQVKIQTYRKAQGSLRTKLTLFAALLPYLYLRLPSIVKFIKDEIKNGNQADFERIILQLAYSKKELTYLENKALFSMGVLETEDYLNDNIEGRYFKKDFGF